MLLQRIFARIRYFGQTTRKCYTFKNFLLPLQNKTFQWPINKNNYGPFLFMGLWSIMGKADEDKNKVTNITTKEAILEKADALYDVGKFHEIYELLKNFKDSNDAEILWRICRALYKMAQNTNEIEAKQMIYEGYDLCHTALEFHKDHYALHKWMSILLNSKSNYEGMKERIKQSFNIKKHMQRALELNPNDPTLLHMLGNWCYQVSNLAWYQRKIAATIFADPPTSSFEEALIYLEKAEKSSPMFYNQNLLLLGQTYLKLNRKDEAIKYLKLASDYHSKNDDDVKAQQEAAKLLKSL